MQKGVKVVISGDCVHEPVLLICAGLLAASDSCNLRQVNIHQEFVEVLKISKEEEK